MSLSTAFLLLESHRVLRPDKRVPSACRLRHSGPSRGLVTAIVQFVMPTGKQLCKKSRAVCALHRATDLCRCLRISRHSRIFPCLVPSIQEGHTPIKADFSNPHELPNRDSRPSGDGQRSEHEQERISKISARIPKPRERGESEYVVRQRFSGNHLLSSESLALFRSEDGRDHLVNWISDRTFLFMSSQPAVNGMRRPQRCRLCSGSQRNFRCKRTCEFLMSSHD